MYRLNLYLVLILLVMFPCLVFSQIDEKESYLDYCKETLTDDANQLLQMGLVIVQSPLHINSDDLLNGLAIGIATGSLFIIDPQVNEIALQNQSALNDKIFAADKYFNGRTATFAASGLYLGGFLLRHEKARVMGLHALETLFISNSITYLFKYSFGRRRPYAGTNQMDFKAFRGSRGKYRSFPSGHTTNAFSFATVMAMSIDNSYWKTFWYGSATMVGLARIYHNRHWISDTFLSALISYKVADFVVHFNGQEKEGFHFYPSLYGLEVRIYF